MFLEPREYTTSQLCRLAATRELALLTDGQRVRLCYWDGDPVCSKARVTRVEGGKPWTIKKSRVQSIQCSSKVARELDLLPRTS